MQQEFNKKDFLFMLPLGLLKLPSYLNSWLDLISIKKNNNFSTVQIVDRRRKVCIIFVDNSLNFITHSAR